MKHQSLILNTEISLQRGHGILRWPIETRRLRRWARIALENQAATLTLRLVGAEEGRQLNAQWRNIDQATNVLTFAYRSEPPWEADIVFCQPVIRAECERASIPLVQHFAHLVIHGILHARGMDHDVDSRAQLMEAREIALLARLRMPDPYRVMDALA